MRGTMMLDKAREIAPQMVAWRRDFHMHPELGFQEQRTSAKIAQLTTGWGYRVRTGVGKTGLVAEFGQGKPVVAIRADMDALPIQEANEEEYRSQNEGVMHACGHDAHMAIALGAAKILSREEFPGTIRFLFQPAEEVEDEEGLSGAPRMIADGAIEGVDYALALHVAASVKSGEIELDEFGGAGVDTFYAKVIGKGGHGSTPQKVIDPIFISGHVILAIHNIVSRRLRPFEPAVISIGSIHGGQIDNVIPEEVSLTGTIRYLNPKVQKVMHAEIQRAMEIAKTLGGDYELRIVDGYPPMNNDPDILAAIRAVTIDLIGEERIVEPKPEMGSEDFGFFIQDIPGAMFYLGCRIEDDPRRHHDARFDINEDCLPTGAAIFASTALKLLSKHSS
jgi:amidohydrolase